MPRSHRGLRPAKRGEADRRLTAAPENPAGTGPARGGIAIPRGRSGCVDVNPQSGSAEKGPVRLHSEHRKGSARPSGRKIPRSTSPGVFTKDISLKTA